MSASDSQWVLVGNAGCRRVQAWTSAIERYGRTPPRLVEYATLLRSEGTFLDNLPPSCVRFESAAEDAATYRLLLKHGYDDARREGYAALEADNVDVSANPRGPLLAPRQAHLGFEKLLRSLGSRDGDILLNPPPDILVQYDKTATLERLQAAGLPVPAFLKSAENYEQIREAFRPAGRAMIKLRHGSGGAGCVAIHWSKSNVRAITTVREDGSQLFTTKTPEVIHSEVNVARLVDRLSRERIHAEQWLPKARWRNYQYDFRVVTVAGRVTHAVARGSLHPFTNLNLGNRRLSWNELRLGSRWDAMRNTAEAAAALFPRSHTLGIDIVLHTNGLSHFLLEINAFGNLLPNLLDDHGRTTHEAAVHALLTGAPS